MWCGCDCSQLEISSSHFEKLLSLHLSSIFVFTYTYLSIFCHTLVLFFMGNNKWLHFISIVTLDVLLIVSNFSTTCQLTLIRVLVYYIIVDC